MKNLLFIMKKTLLIFLLLPSLATASSKGCTASINKPGSYEEDCYVQYSNEVTDTEAVIKIHFDRSLKDYSIYEDGNHLEGFFLIVENIHAINVRWLKQQNKIVSGHLKLPIEEHSVKKIKPVLMHTFLQKNKTPDIYHPQYRVKEDDDRCLVITIKLKEKK